MEIVVLGAGTTSLTNKEIETAVQKLGFQITGVANTTLAYPYSLVSAILGSATMSLSKQDGTITETLMNNTSLVDLAEMSTHNEGTIFIQDLGNNNFQINFSIEIANEAALHLDDGAKLMLALANIPATTAITIDSIDHPVNTDIFLKYETKFVNQNVQKDFSVASYHAIALPVDNVTTLELVYRNGKTCKMSSREIKQILTDSQDPMYVCGLPGTVAFGYRHLAVMSIEDVLIVRVTLNISGNFYLIKSHKA